MAKLLGGTTVYGLLSTTGTAYASAAQMGSTASIATLNVSPLTITAAASGSVFNQIQNTTPGVSASADVSLYNDLGTIYLDMGINSSAYNGNVYGPAFNIVGPNDSYFFTTSANLAHGNTGSTGDLIFFTGGSLSGTSVNSGNERIRIKNTNAATVGGFVGINTSNPTQQLTVSGNISGTGNIVIGAFNTAVNTAGVHGGACNTASGKYSTITGGFSGAATGYATFVGAGSGNNASGSYAVSVGGQYNTASGVYSSINGGCTNVATNAYSVVGGGRNNCNTAGAGVIAGGVNNRTLGGSCSFVGGGCGNYNDGIYTNIVGGGGNIIGGSNQYGFIGSGQNNLICSTGTYSSITNGQCNIIPAGSYSVINGGFGNFNPLRSSVIGGGDFNHTGGYCALPISNASNPTNLATASLSGNGSCTVISLGCASYGSCFSTIGTNALSINWTTSGASLSAGNFAVACIISQPNTSCIIINGDYSVNQGSSASLSATCVFIYDRLLNQSGFHSTIGGGKLNTASGQYDVVVGGMKNSATGNCSFVGGGRNNFASGCAATISGGCQNIAGGTSASILGGLGNQAAGNGAGVVSGNTNCASGNCSFIGGGISNAIGLINTGGCAATSFIGAGSSNIACGIASNIIGGTTNCVTVVGNCSTIAGGRGNTISSEHSFIAGGSANDTKGFGYAFILGTGLSATKANYTYVNNLSVQGNIESNTNYVATLALTANQTMPSNTDAVLTLDPKNDPNNWFSRTAGTGLTARRITPTVPGYYHIDYQVSWQPGVSATGAQNNIQVMKVTGGTNAVNTISIVQQPIENISVNSTQNTSAITYMNGTTDYLYFQGYSSNSSQVITGETNGVWTKVEIFKIN
jgi:hypothetical protein